MMEVTPGGRLPYLVLICVVSAFVLFVIYGGAAPAPISRWVADRIAAQPTPAIVGEAAPLTGAARPVGWGALEQYNQGSALQELAADGSIAYYRRELPGGGLLAYFVVVLDERTYVSVINADGATPGSDATGDTIWTDGKRHLQTVEAMARTPAALRDGMTLLGALAFGFHGDARTSNEGTVVIDGVVHRVNPGRAALCITPDGAATIGVLDMAAAARCHQAIGAGPVVLLNGRIANPQVSAPTDEFVPFNPLGEDFVQIDWRRSIYSGTYPKTVAGVGLRDDGRHYLVLAVSYGVEGVELVRQLKEMGCTDALGGDDDTSTQAIWRGTPLVSRQVRAVPDAIAIYARDG